MKHSALPFVLMVFISFPCWSINFSRINVSWQYDRNAPVRIAHNVITQGDRLSVFLQINADSLGRWDVEYLLQEGYESEKDRKITISDIDTLFSARHRVIIRLSLPKVREDLLVLKMFRFEEYYYYDVGLRIGSLLFPSIYVADQEGLPVFSNYLNRSEFTWENSETFYAMRYTDSFGPADPPMAEMKAITPKATLDSTFFFADTVRFEDGFFYMVRTDSSASTGVTVLKVPPYFPEYRLLPELVESMLYLTSEAERKSLLNSKNLKKAFDSFWINNFNTKSRARNAIRKYYNGVERANRLFTDYKAGWKTDRGMMYIVFGMPDEVYRTNGLEEWYYDSGDFFEFTVISSFFAPRTYALRRNKDLEEVWFQQIASIRRGINE